MRWVHFSVQIIKYLQSNLFLFLSFEMLQIQNVQLTLTVSLMVFIELSCVLANVLLTLAISLATVGQGCIVAAVSASIGTFMAQIIADLTVIVGIALILAAALAFTPGCLLTICAVITSAIGVTSQASGGP